MEKVDNSERIDRFLREQMSLEERNAFMDDLKNDDVLYEEAQITALLIHELKEKRLKQEQEIAQEIRVAKLPVNISKIVYWVGAIAAMFILFFGSVRFYKIYQMNTLFDEYYDPVNSLRSGENATKHELDSLCNLIAAEEMTFMSKKSLSLCRLTTTIFAS